MRDDLGTRMKENYEKRYRFSIPRRTNVIIRVDGRSFHNYTKYLQRPYDLKFMEDMDQTALYMCQNITGAKLAYVQSDEISVLVTDYDTIHTESWFDGNLQKFCSISAGLATAKFNNLRLQRKCYQYDLEDAFKVIEQSQIADCTLATFDSRVFVIPDDEEVVNYFYWRQLDATRNSIQMAGQAYFKHGELMNLNRDQIQEKLFTEKDINWDKYPVGFKRGRAVKKMSPDSEWVIDTDMPIISKDRDYIRSLMVRHYE